MTAVAGAVILACVGLSGTAQASPVLPGSLLVAPDIFNVGSWTLVSAIQSHPIDNGEPSFTLNAAVYNPGNVDCPGCLVFVYQISNAANSSDSITRLTAINFSGWTTYVGYANNGGNLGGPFVDGDTTPLTVDRSVGGDTVGFNFSSASILPPGSTSKVLVIQTNATNFAEGTVGVFGSTGLPNLVDPFQPADASSVPEPASLALLGIGLLAGISVSSFVRRRRARQSV
jgi:PEP-CTERM motif